MISVNLIVHAPELVLLCFPIFKNRKVPKKNYTAGTSLCKQK